MLKDITVGQYLPVNSIIHKLDPRVKLLGTMLYIIALFIGDDFLGCLFAAVFLLFVVVLAKIPVKTLLKGLKAILFILILSAFFNLFWSEGNVLIQIGFLKITDVGALRAIFTIIRLSLLIVGSSVMTLATTPNELADGLEKGLSILKYIHIPVHELAMMISIALRFIPILAEEMEKIKSAQMARGADFESGNFLERIKAMVPLLIPLFVSAFRRADDLSMAMEARCYHGGEGRTKMKPLIYKPRDYAAYLVLVVFFAGKLALALCF